MTDRVSRDEYLVMIGQKRAPKQGRIRSTKVVTADGTFASKREAGRWNELVMELKAGRIAKLRRQVPFALTVNRIYVCKYIGDFVYERDGIEVVEDSKGHRTEIYILKKKLMLAVHDIEILET